MKCPNCGEPVVQGQTRCGYCEFELTWPLKSEYERKDDYRYNDPYHTPTEYQNPQTTDMQPYAPPGARSGKPFVKNPAETYNIFSLILGILGIIFPFFGFLLAIGGLALGIVGRKRSIAAGASYGMATAGIALSIAAIVISVLLIVIVVAAVYIVSTSDNFYTGPDISYASITLPNVLR
ncbi:MAG: hypothetical protein LBN43_03705 [Oscillospiraceae bacterium]|jgi:hypothetical protein|nr:hypothetical protein [Oscillospiraceae bacterium]